VYWTILNGLLRISGQAFPIVIMFVLATILVGSWYVAMFERALAGSLLKVSFPPMAPPLAPDLSAWERLKAHLRNPVTWKALVYLGLRMPFLGIPLVGGVLLLACFALLLAPAEYLVAIWVLSMSHFAQDNPLISPPWSGPAAPLRDLIGISAGHSSALAADLALSVGCLLVGLLALLATLRLLNGITWLWGRFAVLMLAVNQQDLELAEARAVAAREQARADRADNSRRELIVNASHELRTPIASIRAHIESLLILEGEQLPEKVREFLAITLREAERLGTLVDDLLMLARADTDELRLNIQPVATGEIVEEVYQALEPLAEREREVTLVRSVAPDLPPALADRDRLAQVVLNLVRNAIAYTPAGGVVAIDLAASGPGALEVCVTDTGIGIPPGDLERVFDRFYRTDTSRTRGSGGFGLGLSIVRDLVRAMGGTVVAENIPEGGTRFCVTLRSAVDASLGAGA
jgi:signal transduction histidine kinase